MTLGQVKILRELTTYTPMVMRLSRREREEIRRIRDMDERAVLSVELAAWIERVHRRVKGFALGKAR